MSRILLAAALPARAGFVQVGTTSDGQVLLDAEPGAALPSGASVISEGAGRYARTALGTHAERVLDAVWERTVNGKTERHREKMHAATSRNPTVTIVAQDVPPHRWLGES